MRRLNLRLVLQEIMEQGPRSRAAIAESTGLTKSTVSTLVADLTDRGLLSDAGWEDDGTVGRPGRLVELSGESVAGLGLEINVDYLAVCVIDLTGRVRHERLLARENRGSGPGQVFDELAGLGRAAIAACEAEGLTPVAATLGAPGLVDVDTGTLVFAPNLGWEAIPLTAELAARLGRPALHTMVDNEANLAAQGELWQGRGRDLGDFVHISGETGVGAGVVIRGELVRGGAGFGGEFGHIPMVEGRPCPCGSYGCLERLVGQEALLTAAGLEARVGTTVAVPDGGVAALVERARAGDAATLDALHEAGRTLGRALATMVNLFAPNSVVLGGSFAALHDWLRDPLRAELERRSFVLRYADVAVVPSSLGTAAAVRGAAARALRTVCDDPLIVAASG
ncbi:MAG TPA: ROK family transcriptional regulator [Euzebyales bacterium]|nr:ROK family transcriptional regulator [Euzebyales bacterium]